MPHRREATLAELAAMVGGRVCGDPAATIYGAAPLGVAQFGEITLAEDAERLKEFVGSPAQAVVAPERLELDGLCGIAVRDVHAAFRRVVQHFRPSRPAPRPGIHPTAHVAPGAHVSPLAWVGANVTIGLEVVVEQGVHIHPGASIGDGSRIGRDTVIFANATLYPDTIVGEGCLIHASAVLGAYGFGYSQRDGQHLLCAQLGWVELGDHVEVGASSTIDRGVYGPTRIGDGTKIDNLVQIGHNCQIGRHNLICSQVGIAGSTSTGDYVVMGGQCGVRDHVSIGDGAVLGAMCGVSNNVRPGARMLGAPACPEREQKLQFAAIAKLPEMRKEIRGLRRMMEELLDATGDKRPAEGGPLGDSHGDGARGRAA